MSSATEEEFGGFFLNATYVVSIRNILFDKGHSQPPTPIKTDNKTSLRVVTNTIKRKRTKAMDMKFHWFTDRQNQNQLQIYWAPGKDNKGDYYTQHCPPTHHNKIRIQSESLANLVTIPF